MDIGTLTGEITLEDQLSGMLSTISARISQFARSVDTSMLLTAGAVGVVTTAVIAAANSIVNLGEKGSVIQGVEEAFNRLAITAGSTGDALFAGLNEGVKETIDSMQLMQSTNRLLSSGIKLTADDMRLLGGTAREMGKATGTDAAGGLATLSSALLTGNARSLRRFGIQVDLIQAEKDFAKSIGTTRDQLNNAGKVEAARIAMLAGMKTKLDTLGVSEVTFKERVMQSTVAVGNWHDSLAKAVASSPSVNKAFDTIRDSIVQTFGGTSQTVLKTLVGWIDNFADAVTRVGPSIIGMIGRVKDTIVGIWNEVVAFNDRWQITNNLIAGAKFAWGVLEKAFDLVKVAVQAVIKAWSAMPEWLQRITRTALEGSIALAAYSVAIGAVSTPFRSLVGTIDLGINIIGNLSGAIVSSLLIWPKLVLQYNLATAALGRYMVAVRLSAAGHAIETAMLKGVWLAKVDLHLINLALTNAYTALTARILMNSTVLKAHAVMVNVVKGAKALWAIVVAAVSTAYTGLITRLGLTAVAMRASTVATVATTFALESLGFVILGIQAIPLVAALAGIAFGLKKIWEAWGDLNKRTKGQSIISYLHNTRDYDNWARHWVNYISQTVAGVDLLVTKVEDARRRLKGGFGPTPIVPTISPGLLATGSAELQAARAERERLEKRAQGIGLIDDFTIDNTATATENLAKKTRDLLQSFREGDLASKAFAGAFAGLTEAERSNETVLRRIVPEILKYEDATGRLTDGMLEALDASRAYRMEHAFMAASTLALAGATKQSIDAQIEEGKTLEEIAQGYSDYSKGIRITVADIQALIAAEKMRDDARSVALAKAKKDSDAAKAGFNLLTALREQNVEAGLIVSETDTETAIRRIKEANQEILDSHAATGAARGKIAAEVAIKEKREVDAIIVDQKRVSSSSKKSLGEQLLFAQNTYAAMTRVAGSHSDAAIKEMAEEVRARKQAFAGLDVDYAAMNAAAQSTLNAAAKTAKNTYTEAIAENKRLIALGLPEEFSEQAIKSFKKTADAAANAANHTRSVWETAYDALGDVATILDNIPGKFAEIASVAARAGQAIMENLAEGDWVGAIVAGTTAVINIFGKLIGWANAGRNAIKEFAESFDTLAPGTGFDELNRELARLGPETADRLWRNLTQRTDRGDLKGAQRAIEEIQEALAALDADVQKYGLTWEDLTDKQGAATKAGEALIATHKRLTSAGFSAGRVIEQMADDMNAFIIASVRAGTKIPAAMRPIIESMIRTGELSDAAANAILGIADAALPSLADIKDAADRYGITLDELGSKVKQLEITELANQYVKDWDILTAATDDWGVLFDKMGPKVQSLIDDAIKYSLKLPSAMKPMIQAWIDQGKLVDATGEKLTDISQLSWATDLGEMFEMLMTKLDALIDKIGGGLGGALDSVGKRTVRPKIEVDVSYNRALPPSIEPEEFEPEFDFEPESPHAAAGGTIYAAEGAVVPFAGTAAKPFVVPQTPFVPKGTDTVPAMLTPGEVVLNAAQQRNIATALDNLDDSVMMKVRAILEEIERTVVPEIIITMSTGRLPKFTVDPVEIPTYWTPPKDVPENPTVRFGASRGPTISDEPRKVRANTEDGDQTINVYVGEEQLTKHVVKRTSRFITLRTGR